jgi:hypothetical protein
MANTSPQAVRIANEKIRPAADRFGQLYNYLKALQAEAAAESWLTLFPNDSQLVVDGSAEDGRAPITNLDVRSFITLADAYITFMEQASNLNRDLVLKIAVNPERI